MLAAFRAYFESFLHDAAEDLLRFVALPFFDVRGGEITELRSEPQLEGFRRGLRARMAALGIASSTLEHAQVLILDRDSAVVRFENIRVAANGETRGGTQSLAFMRCDPGAAWRAWMVVVVRTFDAS